MADIADVLSLARLARLYWVLERVLPITLLGFSFCRSLAAYGSPQHTPAPRQAGSTSSRQYLDLGARTFASNCSGCHGLDARGGERAPDIATPSKTQHRSDSDLFEIIRKGLPGTGMPAFADLAENKVRALVAYLRLRQGEAIGNASVRGDARAGAALFFGKGQCSQCHTFAGKGRATGGDLSGFGTSRSLKEISRAILHDKESGRFRGFVAVTMLDGSEVFGTALNEDNFSLQLRSREGLFLFLLKSDLRSVRYERNKFTTPNYQELLSANQRNDLAAFLKNAAVQAGAPSRGAHRKASEE